VWAAPGGASPAPTKAFGDDPQVIWRLSPCDLEAVGGGIRGDAKRNWIRTLCDQRRSREIGSGGIGGREELCAGSVLIGEPFGWSALGAIFDLLGELFDLLGFFYEGDRERGACVGMVDLVL
jgi:hypothetical protein